MIEGFLGGAQMFFQSGVLLATILGILMGLIFGIVPGKGSSNLTLINKRRRIP